MSVTAVALSGGVDSAVAADILAERGVPIVGVSAVLLPPHQAGGERGCCDIGMAASLCHNLGIEHHVVDLTAAFADRVASAFLDGYTAGLTPNPCVPCNRHVKFGLLREAARELGGDGFATGHYARLAERNGRSAVRRAADPSKDQSYMLAALSQDQLNGVELPLGELTKTDVLAHAASRRLPCAKRESQDLCFLARGVEAYLTGRVRLTEGPIEDQLGAEVGRHRGLPLYTIGQRRGIGIGGGDALYVVAKDVARNTLIVGPREALCVTRFGIEDLNWVSADPLGVGESLECLVELRYRGSPLRAVVTCTAPGEHIAEVEPHDQSVAPGQTAALYDEDGWLLGGGPIRSADTQDSRLPQ